MIEIYLAANEVADAFQSLAKSVASGTVAPTWSWDGDGIEARVARAAEADCPDDALRIYRRLADRLIDGRNRSSHGQAAVFLARVRHTLETNDCAAEWQAVIIDLRQKHKSLRALREEVDTLGLAPAPEAQLSPTR